MIHAARGIVVGRFCDCIRRGNNGNITQFAGLGGLQDPLREWSGNDKERG